MTAKNLEISINIWVKGTLRLSKAIKLDSRQKFPVLSTNAYYLYVISIVEDNELANVESLMYKHASEYSVVIDGVDQFVQTVYVKDSNLYIKAEAMEV